ncbi:uncharacterized protein LOC143884104 [Tasmannia lanceolata]|uniref:uncharacterized protein LOC143884104 n=1 Tax=Tasmannia lanceolata TaxID=3420 RepID=UPI0040644061
MQTETIKQKENSLTFKLSIPLLFFSFISVHLFSPLNPSRISHKKLTFHLSLHYPLKTHLLSHQKKKKKPDLLSPKKMELHKPSGGIVILFFFFYGQIIAFAQLNPLDFLSLQTIRNSLSDLPGSNFFSSWDFTSDPCNFPGVFCSSNKIFALNLGDPKAGSPGLTGRLDPAFGNLSSLTELSIVPGRITGSLPQTLSQCKNLRFIAISKNFLSGSIPTGFFSNLQTLQTLDLSFNLLTGFIEPDLAGIPSLTNLILSHNRFSGSIPPFISQTLTRFDLKNNNFSGSLPLFFSPSLKYLSLSQNRLTGPVDRVLNRLNRLNYLDLSNNRFTGRIPGSLFSFPISMLQLQRNLFTGQIQPLDRVTISTVDLSYNGLLGEISPLFSSVENLYLNNNKFSGQVPGSFVERLLEAGIQVLYLQHNYLTGIEINPTAEIPLSSSLCLMYNCMVPPLETPCPLNAGSQKSRPTAQCSEWRG